MPKAGRKKAKDPAAPKRALTAFMLFSNVVRPRVKEEIPDATFGEVGRRLGELWKKATPEEKQLYEEKSAQDKERYAEEKKAYLETKPESDDESEDEPEPKKKRAKKVKDPNAPKRPLTPFMLFSQSIRPKIKEDNPQVGFGELGKIIGAKWRELSEDEKKPFYEIHESSRTKYEEEVKLYKESKEEVDDE